MSLISARFRTRVGSIQSVEATARMSIPPLPADDDADD
jgi:hypothetical protein